ncbi:MAG: acyltransferase [Pseudolabrys sp.]
MSVTYRSDIDGLRGVAVLSVIGFHAFPNYVSGGFVGADIFFVISGLLISGVIFDGQEKGNFSFADFYARRIRSSPDFERQGDPLGRRGRTRFQRPAPRNRSSDPQRLIYGANHRRR